MKPKKFIAILTLFFSSCTAAYLIGQNIVLPLTHDNNMMIEETEEGLRDGTVEFSFVDNFNQLVFHGKKKTSKDDIPWGSTIAKIEDDTTGTSIMMLQGTGMSIDYEVTGEESIQWLYNIHPWVAESSDGMTLYVKIYVNDNDIPSLRRSYIVNPDDMYVPVDLPLSEFKDQNIKIDFTTDNGWAGDSVGDWLVLSKLNIISLDSDLPVQKTNNNDYWISAHYFSDSWPANMWDSEFETIDMDLQQIKSDGFNSIILLIPWRQFQPNIGKTNLYNKNMFEKLDIIMQKADEHDLGVIFRIGYTWDYYQNRGHDDILERYENIINDPITMNAWLEYIERIYAVASNHESFWGGFICWEDFWNLTAKAKTISGNNSDSLNYSKQIGFSKYMITNYELSEIRKLFHDSNIYAEEDIYIPTEDQFAFQLFYDFYDSFLNNLLVQSQTTFPNLSMEVRVDDDLVVDEEGNNCYYSHSNTYLCNSSDYTTIMYGIPIGFENHGGKVTWKEALQKTEHVLEKVSQGTQGKRIFIDQFLYYDNTQEFRHNAQLIEDQIDNYLLESSTLLQKYTKGYGVWPYKDCYADAIANGCFSDELNGWNVDGNVKIKEIDGNNKCLLLDGAKITQNTESKVANSNNQITCKFDALLIDTEFTVTLSLNGEEKSVSVKSNGEYFVEFEGTEWGDLTISVDGEGFIDNVKLYNFCQQGLLYSVNGKEGKLIDVMRKLNIDMAKKMNKEK